MRDKKLLNDMCCQLNEHLFDKIEIAPSVYQGYGGHIRLHMRDVSFSDLEKISEICGTKDINVHHEPAGGSEFTPDGNYMEVIIFGSGE